MDFGFPRFGNTYNGAQLRNFSTRVSNALNRIYGRDPLFYHKNGLAGVVIGTAGIAGTDATGAYTFFIDPADGAASFAGDITGSTGTFYGSISIGTSPNWFKADSSGIWLGGATFATSPFRVAMAGTGVMGGFTLGATTLTATSGGNTTILSSGATSFSSGPTGSPTVTITQAGDIAVSGSAIFSGATSTSSGPPGNSANTAVYVSGAKHGIAAIASGTYAALYAETSGAGASGPSFYATNSTTGTATNWPVHAVSLTATVAAIQATAYGTGNAITSSGPIKITATTAPALDIWNTPVGASKFSVNGNNGNTLIAGTLGVTGAITGNLTGNASGTAATVTGAAQTAITSLGTLTGLTIAGNVDSGSAWTHAIGYPNPFSIIYALTHYGYSMLMPEDTSGTVYNDSASLGQISIHQTHNLAAAKYKLGSVPGTGTPPFMYFNIGGKVCLFVDATGAGTQC